MILRYIRESDLSWLKASIEANLTRYESSVPWLEGFFGTDGWTLETNIDVREVQLLPSEAGRHFDLQNSIAVYSALKDLNLSQASDERLWAYLTHVTFWEYMRTRWPVDLSKGTGKAIKDFIRSRYFVSGSPKEALVRNGISRLWWYGYVSYDEYRKDHFELTAVLLRTQDIASGLMERSFSRNPKIVRGVLKGLRELENLGIDPPNREAIRDLMRHFTAMGGVTILDSLSEDDVIDIVLNRLLPRSRIIA